MSTSIAQTRPPSPQTSPSTTSPAAMKIDNAAGFEAEFEKAKQNLTFFDDATTKIGVALENAKNNVTFLEEAFTDIEAVHQQAKDTHVFFEEIMSKKKELDLVTKSVQAHKMILEMMHAQRNMVNLASHQAKEEVAVEATKLGKRQWQWMKRSLQPTDVVFQPFANRKELVEIGFEKVQEAIEIKLEVAKENVELLQQTLHMYNLCSKARSLEHLCSKLEDTITNKKMTVERLKEQETALRKAYEEAVEHGVTKTQALEALKASALAPLDSTMERKDLEISRFKEKQMELETLLKAKESKIDTLRWDLLQSMPLRQVGIDILRRRQEDRLHPRERDDAIMKAGNAAAHYGNASADAVRIELQDTTEKNQTWYKGQYGFSAEFVLIKIRNTASIFLEVVDWHSAMQNFQRYSTAVSQQPFKTGFTQFTEALAKSGKKDDPKVAEWIVNYFTEDKGGIAVYKMMKDNYDAAHLRHREVMKNRY